MAKIRIHELAKKWGVESKDIIARLDKMGITGKKPQSGLTEPEADRVHDAMGLGPQADPEPVPVVVAPLEEEDPLALPLLVTEASSCVVPVVPSQAARNAAVNISSLSFSLGLSSMLSSLFCCVSGAPDPWALPRRVDIEHACSSQPVARELEALAAVLGIISEIAHQNDASLGGHSPLWIMQSFDETLQAIIGTT